MISTPAARDEMQARFYDDWRSKAPLVWSGGVPRVLWDAKEEKDKAKRPRADEPWARVSVQHNINPQRAFGEPGNRRFERLGIIMVQVFSPMSLEQSVTLAEGLGIIARDAFEGKDTPGGVWFRNTRMQEVGPSDPWWQLNVSAEFTYDELK